MSILILYENMYEKYEKRFFTSFGQAQSYIQKRINRGKNGNRGRRKKEQMAYNLKLKVKNGYYRGEFYVGKKGEGENKRY